MSDEKGLSIHQKIAEIQKATKVVGKDVTVNGYAAVTHDKVLSIIRELCLTNGILIFPDQVEKGLSVAGKTAAGKDKSRFEAMYSVRFVSVDDGSELAMNVEGHGEDSNDKGPGKAITYATKSAMLKMFLLATGENDEARMEEETPPPTITESQAADLESLAIEVAVDKAAFLTYLGINDWPELFVCNLKNATTELEKLRK